MVGRSADSILAQIVSSQRRLYLTTACCFLVVFGAKFLFTTLLLNDPQNHEGLTTIDAAIAGGLAAAIAYTLLTLFRNRKRRVLVYIRQVEELNHHVRNAVQALIL